MFKIFVEKYKENGFWGIVLATLRRLRFIKNIKIFVVYQLDPKSVNFSDKNQWTYVVHKSLDAVDELIKIADKRDVFIESLQNGHICIVAYDQLIPVAFLWFQPGPGVHIEQVTGFNIHIDNYQVYYYDSLVLPPWRNKGILKSLLTFLIGDHVSNGRLDKVIAIVEIDNLVSIKAHEKIGFKRDKMELFFELKNKKHQYSLKKYNIK